MSTEASEQGRAVEFSAGETRAHEDPAERKKAHAGGESTPLTNQTTTFKAFAG